METTKKSIYEKVHLFQTGADPLKKDGKNPHFNKTYVTLSNALTNITPLLNAVGLVLLQPVIDGVVKTVITDVESGEIIESSIPLPSGLDAQKTGSAITYFRRYTLCSLLAIAFDEDDDGNVASGNARQQTATVKPPVNNAAPAAKEDLWLNKYTNKAQTDLSETWKKVVSALQSGEYTLADVQKKYKLSAAIKSELEQIALAAV
jgi:hypothetical protein